MAIHFGKTFELEHNGKLYWARIYSPARGYVTMEVHRIRYFSVFGWKIKYWFDTVSNNTRADWRALSHIPERLTYESDYVRDYCVTVIEADIARKKMAKETLNKSKHQKKI